MKFDSNSAWKQASSSVSGNRDVLLALSGVFFLLPSLAFSLLFPQPEPAAGMGSDELVKLMSDYYASALPFLIPVALFQAAGTLAMLTLFTDRTRPTVGQAIRQGLAGILPYFLAQIMLALGIGLVGATLLAVAAVTGAPVVIGLAFAAVLLLVAYAAIRTSLVAPIVAVEHERNPLAALRRSWALTTGNSARLGLFFVLVIAAFLIVVMLAMAIVGIVLALVASPGPARVVAAVVSAALGAVMSIYMVAILAAAHRQLAGPSPEAVGRPFE